MKLGVLSIPGHKLQRQKRPEQVKKLLNVSKKPPIDIIERNIRETNETTCKIAKYSLDIVTNQS